MTEMTEKTSFLRKTTLGELGPNLPIGMISNGQLKKNISCRRWRFAEEKKLSAYKKDNKGVLLGDYIAFMMGMLMTEIGDHKWIDEITPDNQMQRLLSVYGLYQPDVLYMFMYARKVALGNILEGAEFSCPYCQFENKRNLDLDDLDVLVIDKPEDLEIEIELKDGLVIHKELRKKISVTPPKWELMQHPAVYEEDEALLTAETFKRCIVKAEGCDPTKPIVLLDQDLDELSYYDLQLISRTINDNTPGPKMVIEIDKCKKCRKPFKSNVDFGANSFFSSASG
jgi:hypothetical protein